jgi:aromatic-L-amino-acid decarboxylase
MGDDPLASDLLDPGQLGLGDMDPAAFRRYAHQAVEWIAEFLEHPERYPVLAQVEPGQIRSALPARPPERPEPMSEILNDFERTIVPGITHWNHPGFFAYFAITGSGPGIIGELLAAALNANGMLWKTAPAVTELEEVTLDWLRQLVGLPAGFEGAINDTASSSSLYALTAAREAVDGLEARRTGLCGRPDAPRLRLYVSSQTHSSIDKAAIVLGVGLNGVARIPTDDQFRMDPAALEAAIDCDLKDGWRPFAVVPTVGTTATTSIDPVPAIADLAERYGLWLHVDAAYGGPLAILPERREVLAGCERADSLVLNPHKWLFTPIDCSVLYCRRPELLRQAFSQSMEILEADDGPRVRNLMDYGTALGRRFRALKLWAILRYFGAEGIRARLREHLRLAQLFAGWIDASHDFERVAEVPFSTVCFRYAPPGEVNARRLDALNQAIHDRVNSEGAFFINAIPLRGRQILRVAIGNLHQDEATVRALWAAIRAAAASAYES